jgi:simple sugar transport system ATP-binding protein
MMIGASGPSSIEEKFEKNPSTGRKLLEVIDLWVKGDRGEDAVKGVRLFVREGEIVGVAGVAGSGEKELAEAIYGLRPVNRGRIMFNEVEITRLPTVERIKLGISYIPEERVRYGVSLELPIYENIYLEKIHSEGGKGGLLEALGVSPLKKRVMLEYAQHVVNKFGVKTPSLTTVAGKLSGGNIQRLIVGRELERGPKLVIASEPTAGLDIAATNFVRRTLMDMSRRGVGVLLISSDLQEVLSLSHKVVVLCNGEVMGVVIPGEASIEDIGLMMTCSKKMSIEEVEKIWAM